MNAFSRIFMFSCLICFISCNQEKPNTKSQDKPILNKEAMESSEVKATIHPEVDNSNPKWRSQALAVIDFRIKNNPKTFALIEADVLEYKFVYNGKKMSQPEDFMGMWIDFKPDFTYDYGKYSDTQGEGRYYYSLEKGELVMVDNDTNTNPQEWTVKSAGDVMIFVGTRTYGNNSYQMKMERIKSIPSE